MTERTYNQYCPVAYSLDLIGERWAMLIIRDLFLGPKRFTDLIAGLPGLGSNILSSRLKALEQNGVVRRRTLPPPAASTVYELTAAGQELEESLTALAHWGCKHLGERPAQQILSVESVKLGLYDLFRPLGSVGETLLCAVSLEDAGSTREFEITLTAGAIQVNFCAVVEEAKDGGPDIRPDLTLSLAAETLFALVGGRVTLLEAHQRGIIRLEGEPALVHRFLSGSSLLATHP